MSGNADERLIIQLEARIAEFERNFKRAEQRGTRTYGNLRRGSRRATGEMERDMSRASQRINQSIAGISTKLGGMGKAFAVGLAAVAIGKLTSGLRDSVRAVATLGDQARRAGVDLQTLQEFAFVGGQNRIELDAFVEGFKELNLRVDEFVTTGGGTAADAFARIGYSAEQLKAAIEDPGELLTDIIGRMESLDEAAQIRIGDEIFGGSAGERFVELIRQGEGALRETVARAHEVGAILDNETVERAAELDARFSELSASVGNFFQRAAVGSADFVDNAYDTARAWAGIGDEIERAAKMQELYATGQAALQLVDDDELLAANADAVEDTVKAMSDLAAEAYLAQIQLAAAANELEGTAYIEAYDAISALAQRLDELTALYGLGEVSAEDFRNELGRLTATAQTTLVEVAQIDGITFGNAIAGVDAMANALNRARAFAEALTAALPNAGVNPGRVASQEDRAGDVSLPPSLESYPAGATRPQGRPADIDFGYLPPTATGGGGAPAGGGGGSAPRSAFAEELESLREKTTQLLLEAAELTAAADSGRNYGDAMEYAKKRAELLYAAQQDGREITPELAAEIDTLAQEYVNAGLAADEAADRIDRITENSERGAETLADLFMSMEGGADSAREAVANLLRELARMSLQRGFMSLFGPGGPASGIGAALGGLLGRETGGPVSAGTPYIINERTPNSEVFVPSQSGAVLNVPQAQAALRGRGGSDQSRVSGKVELIVRAAEGVTIEQVQKTAQNISVQVTQEGMKQIRNEVPSIMNDFRRRF